MQKRRIRPKSRTVRQRTEPAFEGPCRDVAGDGRGVVGHPDGRTFLVSGCWPGERVRVQPERSTSSVGFGRVTRVLEPATQRIEATCRHHGFGSEHCGGCPWMFVDYASQCEAKQRRVASLLERQGVTCDTILRPILPSVERLGYRNRAQFKTDGQRLGYLAASSHSLVDIEACAVLNSECRHKLDELRGQLPNAAWKPQGRRHQWRTLDIDDRTPDARLDERLPFRQGNSTQNAVMQAWLAEAISDLATETRVLELFAGAGNFTSILTQHFSHIDAVEGNAEAVEALAALSESQVRGHCVNLFNDAAVADLVTRLPATELLLLDPPREGLKVRAPLIHGLGQVRRVIYIACDAATWMRDCTDWLAAGFEFAQVQPIDLFPQTPHVEILSILERKA